MTPNFIGPQKVKEMFKKFIGLFLFILGFNAFASGLDISLSDSSARFAYLTESGALGYAGTDVSYSLLYTEAKTSMGGATILVVGNAVGARRSFQYGFGAKANFGKMTDNTLFSAVSIGGTLRYLFPSENPIGLSVEAFSSPSITSFGNTKNVLQYATRLDLEIMPNTRGYIGYRKIEVKHTELNQDIDDTVVFGIRLSF